MPKIISFESFDVRFPTSTMLDGSDAMNADPDYSAAYVRLMTDSPITGDSLVFTIGRGNEIQIAAINILAEKIVGLDLDDAFTNIGAIAKELSSDSQLRWLGPDMGVFHMAAGAVLNSLWDLFSKNKGVPLWKFLSDMSSEEIVAAIDFRYISDALTPEEALEILNRAESHKSKNEAILVSTGVPAYTTTPGWLGYSDEKMLHLTQEALHDGFSLIKYKCGKSLSDDRRRLGKIRELVGPDFPIAIDANQVWDVGVAITWINSLKEFNLRWIEEPTHPDDVLGHARIAREVAPTPVATGEMASSRIIFKQLLQSKAISVMQIDASRVAGVNENLANVLMAAKFNIPVCPHAGGVGLCEMVQHIAMWDSVAVSGHHSGRVVEYVDHLHEHFLEPTNISRGRYMTPQLPGAGAQMHQSSIDTYIFPTGDYWMNGVRI
ncbi:MAG: L-fuconate dehydratase [Actinobacteria bacterium]|jgi:L-fuconate dehydratase|nr:L-fuconate dehydratase [Actinomycetota bacterium]